MPDAKFESDSCTFFFRQNVSLPRMEQVNWDICPLKMDLIFKNAFYVENRLFRPKISPYVNFSKFQAQKSFFILKIF